MQPDERQRQIIQTTEMHAPPRIDPFEPGGSRQCLSGPQGAVNKPIQQFDHALLIRIIGSNQGIETLTGCYRITTQELDSHQQLQFIRIDPLLSPGYEDALADPPREIDQPFTAATCESSIETV